MAFDAHKNFALGRVAIAPTPADSGTSLVLVTGDALKMPATPFNATVSATNARPSGATAEIVRVTLIVGDTLTIVRVQEGTSARSILPNDDFSATLTAKSINDVETVVNAAIKPSTAFAGDIVFGDASGRVLPGATQLLFRNNADNANNVVISDAGLVTVRNGVTLAAGPLILNATASKIIPGATSLSFRNTGDSADNLLISDAGAVTIRNGATLAAGNLVFGAASGKIIPGATSLLVRNNADSATHISITNAGQMTFLPETAATGFPGTSIGVQFGTTSNTYTTPTGTGSSLVRIDGNFQNTNNVDESGYWRVLETNAHWTDTLHGASTFAGAYFNVFHDTATVDVQDIIGVIGRVFFTSTGKSSIGAWGVRGDLNFSGAADLRGQSIVAGVIGHQGSWAAAGQIDTYAGVASGAHTLNTGGMLVRDGHGLFAFTPTGATRSNWGLGVYGSNADYSAEVVTGGAFINGGTWIRGQSPIPAVAYTGGNATLFLMGGTHGGANDSLVALYFYRSTVAKNYIGIDSDSTSVIAGHTKSLDDFVLRAGVLVFDANGQIFSKNRTTTGQLSIIPTVVTSGTMPSAFTYTGAAHTGLTIGSFAEFNWNANRVITFNTSGGGGTIATAYTFQFQRPQYAFDVSTTITLAATMRITGAPSNSSNTVFTATYAMYIDSGNIGFGGAANFVLDTGTGTKIGTATTQKLGFWNAAPIVQPTFGATIVNNVTVGGTTKQLDDFVGTTYATDSAAIRNDIYQLGAAFKILVDALRLEGLLS